MMNLLPIMMKRGSFLPGQGYKRNKREFVFSETKGDYEDIAMAKKIFMFYEVMVNYSE